MRLSVVLPRPTAPRIGSAFGAPVSAVDSGFAGGAKPCCGAGACGFTPTAGFRFGAAAGFAEIFGLLIEPGLSAAVVPVVVAVGRMIRVDITGAHSVVHHPG